MRPFAPSRVGSGGLLIEHLHARNVEVRGDQLSNEPLLIGNAPGRIDDFEPKLFNKTIVLRQDPALEQPKAFDGVRTPPHVHSRLVKLELHTPSYESVERNVNRDTKIQRQIRP